MTYVDGLSTALAVVNELQQNFDSLSSGAGGFESVLAQVAGLSGTTPGGTTPAAAPAASGATGAYGYALQEGAPIYAGQAGGFLGGIGPGQAAGSGGNAGAGSPATSASAGAASGVSGQPGATGAAAGADIGQQAVAQAETFLGVPYQWGGTDPATGVDCSGLVQDVYSRLGVDLPRTSQEQALVGTAVGSLAQAQPGDLVFYPGSDGTATAPGHVGIYIGNGQMIDAPHAGADVRVDPVGTPTEIRRVAGLAPAASGPELPGGAAAAGGGTGSSGVVPGTPAGLVGTFEQAAATYNVPASLLSSVAFNESSFRADIGSAAGAKGLMALMPATAASYGVDPYDPAQAVPAAAQLLAGYHQKYGSWSLALAAYNAGPGAVAQYGGIPPYPQTQAYVAKVLSDAGMEGQ